MDRADHLEPYLGNPFQAVLSSDGGAGFVVPVEGSGAHDLERAALVVADRPRSDRGERVPDGLGVSGRAERDDLAHLGARSADATHEGPSITIAETVREPVVDSAGRRIEGGVRAVDLDAGPDRTEHDAARRVAPVQPLERFEDQRVIGEDRVRFGSDRLLEDRLGQVDGQEDPIDLVGSTTDQFAHVVPALGVGKRGDLLHRLVKLCSSDRHDGASVTFPGSVTGRIHGMKTEPGPHSHILVSPRRRAGIQLPETQPDPVEGDRPLSTDFSVNPQVNPPREIAVDKKHFVLDTNVLLHNPNAIFRFDEHEVVIPLTVIEELDSFKKNNDETGRNARQVIRSLDELRSMGRLFEGVVWNDEGGTVRIDRCDRDQTFALDLAHADNRSSVWPTLFIDRVRRPPSSPRTSTHESSATPSAFPARTSSTIA